MKSRTKNIVLAFTIVISILFLLNFSSIAYLIKLAKGQAKILLKSESISQILLDKSVPDTIKSKLIFILEVKKFAEDSLKLRKTNSYISYCPYSPEVWIVTACNPYSFQAKMWQFPIVGELSYKGFFDKNEAEACVRELASEGYDTDISKVAAWSTLGWFNDPVLPHFMKKNEGQLASLILHELTHSTVFFQDNLDFNENLANHVAEFGTKKFLSHRFGAHSIQSKQFENYLKDYKTYRDFLKEETRRLDSLFHSSGFKISTNKALLKQLEICRIVNRCRMLSFNNPQSFLKSIQKAKESGNAFFIDYLRYDGMR